MPDVPKTAAEFDRQVTARAVCFTAVLATGRKRERFEFPCIGDTSRYNAFLNATTKAKALVDAYGRRGMVYAVDAAGRDVHLAEAIWLDIEDALRTAGEDMTVYRYYEYDGAYFRGQPDIVGVEQVWDMVQQRWAMYGGRDRLRPAMFGAPATKDEAESQHWENGRVVTTPRGRQK